MTWIGWIVGLVGVWVIIEPYLNMSTSSNKILLVITGIVLVILGLWGAMSKNMSQ